VNGQHTQKTDVLQDVLRIEKNSICLSRNLICIPRHVNKITTRL